MAGTSGAGQAGAMPGPTDSLTVVCNDCGEHAHLPAPESGRMLEELHAFLDRHRMCSYEVTVESLPHPRRRQRDHSRQQSAADWCRDVQQRCWRYYDPLTG